MEQILSMLMSLVMVFVQFIVSFIGGGAGPVLPNPDPGTDPANPASDMRWPLSHSSYVSAGYPNYSDGTYHGGIDIVLSSGDSEGEPFVAVKDGTVEIALNDGKDNSGYGNCVLINHGNGLSTFYAHAKTITVTKDQKVVKGQTIGTIGKTGNATAPHLHFEVWKETNGSKARVNPLDYVTNPYSDVWDNPANPDTPSDTVKGSFKFTVYGYGHGVGMSQDGAIKMAKDGKTYDVILKTYYPGTALSTDTNTPAKVTKNGKEVSLVEFLCKTVAQEIGDSSPLEALKAQAVASYTYSKLYGYGNGQAYKNDFNYSGTNVEKAVFAVLNISKASEAPMAIYVTYGGKTAETYYFSNCAGMTANIASVWGGEEIAYLKGKVASPETVMKSEKTYTAAEFKKLVEEYAKKNGKTPTFDSDPSNWIKIVSHDKSMGNAAGYINTISVCGISMSGNTFRSKVLGNGIKSHCFTVEYIK